MKLKKKIIKFLGRLRNRTPKNMRIQDELSDPDDDKPLHLMVSESPQRGRPARNASRYSDEHVSAGPSNSATYSATRSSRTQKRPHYIENDTDEEEEEEDIVQQTKRRNTQSSQGR